MLRFASSMAFAGGGSIKKIKALVVNNSKNEGIDQNTEIFIDGKKHTTILLQYNIVTIHKYKQNCYDFEKIVKLLFLEVNSELWSSSRLIDVIIAERRKAGEEGEDDDQALV